MDNFSGTKQSLFDGFRRLTPQMNASTADPVQTSIVAAATNIFDYAFEAYKTPEEDDGFTEETTDGNQIQYLNFDAADAVFDSVLKIHLKEARNVTDADLVGFRDMSDPYVTFSAGSSAVRSEVIRNTKNPVWYTNHYLVLRKTQVKNGYDGKLHVSLFDRDSMESRFPRALSLFANGDELLGSGTLDLEELKKPGVHSFVMKMGKQGRFCRSPMTVHFTVEHISFKDACTQMRVFPENGKGRMGTELNGTPIPEFEDLSWIVELGSLETDPIAFINGPSTGTQAWMRVNSAAKMLIVSFRGTEIARIKDVLTDVRATKQQLGPMREDHYAIRPTGELVNDEIRVHSGFLKAYTSVRETILQLAYEITGWDKEWSICLTGHSLGGALATLTAFEFGNRKNNSGQMPVIGMLSFGSPRVGNSAFARIYNATVQDTFRVVDEHDIIHVLPPRFVHTAREVLILPTGEVFVEGKPLRELGCHNVFTNNREVTDDAAPEDSGSVREIIAEYGKKIDQMIEKHLKPNYTSIVRNAVRRFFGGDQ